MTAAPVTILTAMIGAGFRRHATYRQAMIAATWTNTVFGFLRCFILIAAVRANAGAPLAGYDEGQLVLYAWVSQGLLGVVALWGWTELADRIRTGEVIGDLLRPVHPVLSYLATDLGRAGYAMLTRFVAPVVIGALFFPIAVPGRPQTLPLFAVSALLAVVVCFGARYLVNAIAFWLLDVRGIMTLWALGSSLLAGLAFPLQFLPGWLRVLVWVGTPFPSMLQAPLDVIVERGSPATLLGEVAGQAAWAAVLLALCWYVQHRATRRLVVQGG